jgi:hypothetical protein
MAAGSMQPVSRAVTFGPALAAAAGGWAYLGQPLHWAGLAAMMLAGLLVIPSLVVMALFFVPAALRGAVPADWRKRHRQRLMAQGIPRGAQRSSYISKRLKHVTFAADRHRCVACGSRLRSVDHMEWDHVKPWSLGGLTTLSNGMTLCPACNKIKSNYWRFRGSGHRVYVPFEGWANEAAAAEILAAELRHRWNPLRLTRAAWALAA